MFASFVSSILIDRALNVREGWARKKATLCNKTFMKRSSKKVLLIGPTEKQ
jgi:hypothetical protein